MSPEVTTDVSAEALAQFDMIVDVRSPAEFAEDHVPGAANLPVLSNEERATVGAIYVQESRFKARRLGAALVARNIAGHLQTALADKDGSFRPLVYCWRGGMRSNAMATILSQVGWRTRVLSGGYRTWRRQVTARLYDGALPHRLVLLDGPTGTAKTELLGRLAARGLQTLDLEGLAEHRGSLFGGLGRPQPSQKMFESRMLAALDALDPGRPVIAEAESSKIGDRMIPPALWTRLAVASRIELVAEPADRAGYLVAAYADVIGDRARLEAVLERLPTHPSRERLESWRALADAGAFAELAQKVMALHYDPAYARSRRKHGRPLLRSIALDPADPSSQEAAADAIAALMLDAGRLERESEGRSG
jgi:tRNA 2-selenouridine synthase